MQDEHFNVIVENELKLLDPSNRRSPEWLNEIIHDDFTEFASSSRIYHKKEILKNLPNEVSFQCEMQDKNLIQLAGDVVLLTFKTKKTNEENKQAVYSLRSSLWKNFNGQWKLVFHQGTNMC